MTYVIETSRFMWGGQDEFETEKEARAAVREFLRDVRAQGQRGWRKIDSGDTDEDVILEYEHISWDPYKPERIMIVNTDLSPTVGATP